MNTTKKIALGLAGGVIAIAGPLGAVAAAHAAAPTPTPTASAPWQGGMGMSGRWAGPQAMNGTGYGATAMADYLAGKLGVPADAVTTALQQYHVDNPTTGPGRDLSAADLSTRQKAVADYLASALKVDAAQVRAALESFQSDRQAAMTTQVKERLDAMVAAGTITQPQADAMLGAHEAGQPMMLGGGHGGGPRH